MEWMPAAILVCSVNLATSCSNEDGFLSEKEGLSIESVGNTGDEKSELMAQFAQVLSEVVCSNQQVRELIRSEAVKQFDKNYDVLWIDVAGKKAGKDTFRNIMVAKSSEEFISSIERNVPLLNILFPKIAMFDICAENYDSSDAELPVAFPTDQYNALYYNGKLTDKLEKGQIPSFNVLVVNENSRVVVEPATRSGSSAGYYFKSPAYDGTQDAITRGTVVAISAINQKVIDAYNYFNADDGSVHSMALQRDYLYYGITPTQQSGSFNHNVSEYLCFMEVDPKMYFFAADQTDLDTEKNDPRIVRNSVSRKKKDFTEQELIDVFWTKGAYNFRIEVQTSTKEFPQIIYVPLRPDEIWNFNLQRDYRHPTAFRHSKYTYTIDPNKFTAKRCVFKQKELSLGKWNIAEEALFRYITIMEEDESTEITDTYSYETIKVHASKFSGDIKLEIGLGKNKASGGVSTEVSSSNTIKETKAATVKRNQSSDNLGNVRIYFYDPIIEKSESNGRKTSYELHTYNTGYVKFGVAAY